MVTTLDFGISDTMSEGHPALGLFQDDTKKEALAITSSDIGRSYYQLGKVYYDKADLDKAEDAFVKALLDMKSTRACYTLPIFCMGFQVSGSFFIAYLDCKKISATKVSNKK